MQQQKHVRAARNWPQEEAVEEVEDVEPLVIEVADDSDADPVSFPRMYNSITIIERHGREKGV